MGLITRNQTTALARLVSDLRPDWEFHGVMAAITLVAPFHSAFDVVHAAVFCAADPAARTPGFLAQKGPHWDRAYGTPPAPTARPGSHDDAVFADIRAAREAFDLELHRRGYAAASAALAGRDGGSPT